MLSGSEPAVRGFSMTWDASYANGARCTCLLRVMVSQFVDTGSKALESDSTRFQVETVLWAAVWGHPGHLGPRPPHAGPACWQGWGLERSGTPEQTFCTTLTVPHAWHSSGGSKRPASTPCDTCWGLTLLVVVASPCLSAVWSGAHSLPEHAQTACKACTDAVTCAARQGASQHSPGVPCQASAVPA